MVLGDRGFRAKHIPGPLNTPAPEVAAGALEPEDEIVVYCSGDPCPASNHAYHIFTQRGYKHVRRYAGGVAGWEEAGYPIEGDRARLSCRADSRRAAGHIVLEKILLSASLSFLKPQDPTERLELIL